MHTGHMLTVDNFLTLVYAWKLTSIQIRLAQEISVMSDYTMRGWAVAELDEECRRGQSTIARNANQ
jgi:hypothetical protein